MSTDDGYYDFKFYRYDPSIAAAVIFIILFVVATVLHSYQMFRTRTWYFIPFVLGGIFECIGYGGRVSSGTQSPNWTLGPYIIQAILILVAPALFAASIYMELGRIILLTEGERHALVKRRWLTKLFVAGDVVSFLLQGAGGGIQAGGSLSSYTSGEHIIIGGLVVQILFFSLFLVVSVVFHTRMVRHPTSRVVERDLRWLRNLYALYAGSLLILVRSVFRLAEYAEGNNGYLISHEWFLYVFDGCLMLGTMCIFAWFHPSEINAMLKGNGGKAMRHAFSVYAMV